MNKLLLIIGGAPCRDEDVKEFRKLKPVKYDICCINRAGLSHIGPFKYWVSFHADHLLEWAKYKPNSGAELWSCRYRDGVTCSPVPWGGGSSTLVAVQLALFTWEYHRIVVAGAPLTGGDGIGPYDRYLPDWYKLVPDYLGRVRSMSGNTAKVIGVPDKDFVSVIGE